MQFFANPQAGPANVYGPAQQAVLGDAGLAAARAEIGSWDGYAPTPLVELPGLARRAGVGRLFYKDEGGRFGLKSFKALGGAYAVFRLLKAEIERRTGDTGVTSRDIAGGAHREIVAGITVTCATDGNHGRSVAWGARTFGCSCVIYIHAHVSEGRRAAIARYGAEVERVSGTYDDSVRHAAEMAAANGWFVVSDTSYPGYMDVPRDVMQGYTVMVIRSTFRRFRCPTASCRRMCWCRAESAAWRRPSVPTSGSAGARRGRDLSSSSRSGPTAYTRARGPAG